MATRPGLAGAPAALSDGSTAGAGGIGAWGPEGAVSARASAAAQRGCVGGVPEALRALEEEELSSLGSGPILTAARALVLRGAPLSAMELARELGDEDDRRLVNGMAVAPIPTESATPEDCVLEIKRWHLEARMSEIEKQIPRAQGAAQDALLAEHLTLKQRIAGLSKPLAVSR